MRLFEAVDTLLDTYNSIDVRVVAFLDADIWHSAFTVIRFRRETVDELKQIHDKMILKCGLLEKDDIRVRLCQFQTNDWKKIYANLGKKFISLSDDFSVNFSNIPDFNTRIAEARTYASSDYVNTLWDSFHTDMTQSGLRISSLLDDHSNDAVANHFYDIRDYLCAILEIHRNDVSSEGKLILTAPVFFKISKVVFKNNSINMIFTTYPMDNIKIGINFFRADVYGNKYDLVDTIRDKLEITSETNSIQQNHKDIEINTQLIGNEFEITITKNDQLLIGHLRDSVDKYWPDKISFVNPLFGVFENFVKFEELKKMLFDFEARDKQNSAIIFERAVTWLLNLVGINAILLEDYQKTGKGAKEVSMDIIASIDKKSAILVNVTTTEPKQHEFDQQRNYRNHIQEKIVNSQVKLKSILISGKSIKSQKDLFKSNDIILIGKEELEQVIELIQRGKTEEAKNFLLGENVYGAPL
jgi:hypothetical protein